MVKLQLEHQALGLLLEKFGDEFVLELRRCVLESALSKHIKTLIGNSLDVENKKLINTLITKEIGEIKYDWKGNKVELVPEFHKKIIDTARENVDKIIETASNKLNETLVEFVSIEKQLLARVNLRIDKEFDERVGKKIKEKLDNLMKQI